VLCCGSAGAAFKIVGAGGFERTPAQPELFVHVARQIAWLTVFIKQRIDRAALVLVEGLLAKDRDMTRSVERETQDAGIEVLGEQEVAGCLVDLERRRFIRVPAHKQPASWLWRVFLRHRNRQQFENC
jgi:hypothetical protein